MNLNTDCEPGLVTKHQCWTSPKLCWLSGNKSLQPGPKNILTVFPERLRLLHSVISEWDDQQSHWCNVEVEELVRKYRFWNCISIITYLWHVYTKTAAYSTHYCWNVLPPHQYCIQTLYHMRYTAYFSRSTLCPIERWTLLGFAEVRVVWVTAPELFTWVKCTKLKHRKEENLVLNLNKVV